MASLTVADIMAKDVVTVSPDDDVTRLIAVLREHELPGVPVTEAGRLVGIVTESDLVLRGDDADLHLPHYVQLFGGVVFIEPLRHMEEKLRRAFANKVRDMMTTEVDTLRPGADVHEAARLISRAGHNRMPVVDGDRLVGVVTRVDLLEALTR